MRTGCFLRIKNVNPGFGIAPKQKKKMLHLIFLRI